jgi:D-glycero-D-manno-heptose 1,7-bisphosphate phosphatase
VRRAVFLDRDGVLNRMIDAEGALRAPSGPAELELLPGVAEAAALLAQQGLLLVVVTNQPDVARGLFGRAGVEEIHARLRRTLPLHDVFACFHEDRDGCDCRKPLPGMLLRAASEHGIDLARSFLVGDRWKDVAAGRAAGCTTFLVERPYSEPERCRPDHRVVDLLQAARLIVARLGGAETPA